MVDFATVTREYEKATMSNNISKDICEHYGVELPTDAFYKAGGMDFRNDCGEAISSCMSSLNRDQLNIISKAEAILLDAQVDLILAETDGVPEATAEGGEMFGMGRMTAALNRRASGSPEQILGSVRSAVDDFVGDAEQFDDLTMMCLEYKGPVNAGRS